MGKFLKSGQLQRWGENREKSGKRAGNHEDKLDFSHRGFGINLIFFLSFLLQAGMKNKERNCKNRNFPGICLQKKGEKGSSRGHPGIQERKIPIFFCSVVMEGEISIKKPFPGGICEPWMKKKGEFSPVIPQFKKVALGIWRFIPLIPQIRSFYPTNSQISGISDRRKRSRGDF